MNAGQKWPFISVGIGNVYFAIYIIKKTNQMLTFVLTDSV